ncbi:MAG: DMT family transporter [Betaproteobacteria bacterium]|nr:DMT family transporter [Betaproteobacteria bacterium]
MTEIIQPHSAFFVLAVATSYALVGICTGLALEAGSNVLTVVAVRTSGTVLLLLAYFRAAGVSLAMPARERGLAIRIGILLCLGTYLINAAFVKIQVPLAVLILYLWPAITTGISWALGKERFRWRILFGLVFAFTGVALSLNVEFNSAQWTGVALAIGSSLAWSAVFLLTEHFFQGRDSRPATFTMLVTAAVIFALLCAVSGEVVMPSSASGWAGLSTMPFFYAFALIGLFLAISSIGASKSGFYMNFEPIASVLLAAPILGQRLAPIQLAGGTLVVAALFLFRPLRR